MIHFWRRIKHNPRANAIRRVTIEPNFAGQGGDNILTFKDTHDGTYYNFRIETMEDWKQLASIVGILRHNIPED